MTAPGMRDETDRTYAVVTTDTADAAIREQARYIAIDQQSPQNAAAWLERVWAAIDGLEFLPKRHGLAIENEHVPYEVRRVLVDNHLLLFTVAEEKQMVYIVGLRHGARLPRPQDLPPG